MTGETMRRVARRFALAGVIIFVGALWVATGLGIGAHDPGAIWLFAAEALAALFLIVAVLGFLASFLVSRQAP
jgi:hypothetical protein